MRQPFHAGLLALAMLLGFAIAAPAATSAATPPKVVIIVGPAGSATRAYRSDAEAAATEAARYTSNVVTIESPNATWAAVEPALQGASIVVYMGHGSGFPSPYSTTLQPESQDGLGLNPTAGGDDSTTQYWGEQYLAGNVRLAPNAVVILGHLCYASGTSEPGYPDPTLDVAQQRVDNFAAGFIAAGARAVIAEAYDGSAARYIDALFTAHDSVGHIWATSPGRQGQPSSFASSRSPGMTGELDPDASSGKFYRSMVGDLALSSDAVIGGGAPGPLPSPSPTASPDPVPSASPPPPAVSAPPPTANPAAPGSVRWTTTSVRLRAQATTHSRTLAVLAPNTPVRVRAIATDTNGNVWYRAWTKLGTGWLASWLTSATRAVSPTAAASPAADPGWQTARASSFGVGDGLVGQPMACGGVLTDSVMAVAHLTLPCGTHVRFRYNGQVVDAQVLDRGPYVDGITFDLSPAVCHALGDCGLVNLEWQLAP